MVVLTRYQRRQLAAHGAANLAFRAAPYARAGVQQLSRYVQRRMQSKGTQAKSQATHSGQGVTFESDKARVYRRKRMPKRKRRKWRKLIKLDRAIDLKKCGSRTYVFNAQETDESNVAGEQGVFHCALYSGESTLKTYLGDVQYICKTDNELSPTADLGVTVSRTSKLFFMSGVLDLTIRNTSYFPSGGSLSGLATLEVDIYEVISKRPWFEKDDATTLKAWPNIQQLFTECEGDMKGINNADPLEYNFRGVTPWDQTYALSRFGIKILKKTKYRISNGNTITYQMRDPKNRVISKNRGKELAGVNVPGWTRHVLIYYKTIPGILVGTDPGATSQQISIGITRKYMYKVENGTEKRASYISR